MSQRTTGLVNAAWRLVIEEGYSRKSAAIALGIPESRIHRILHALHARRRRAEIPARRQSRRSYTIVLQDDPLIAEAVGHLVSMNRIPTEVVHATSEEEFLHTLDRDDVDVIVSDYSLDNMNPLRALNQVKERHPAAEFFILSDKLDPLRISIARSAGVAAVLDRRHMAGLVSLIREAIALRVGLSTPK